MTRTSRLTALALLGLVCLMAIPSIAHARYQDGMNLYQYVRSAPTTYVDPMGLQKVKGNKYGDWDITQNNTNAPRRGARYSSNVIIKFIPEKKTVCCDKIAFIQAARLTDSRGGLIATPGPSRATEQHWSIDRLRGRKSPFYGYDNSGRPSASITPGSAPTPYAEAVLRDRPGASVQGRWEFETVAICKKGKDEKKVYGALTWGFDADKDGKLKSHAPHARNLYSLNFLQSMIMWNMQALGHTAAKNHADQQLILIESQFDVGWWEIVGPPLSEDDWKDLGKDYARRHPKSP